MFDRVYASAARFRSTLTHEQQRTVRILGVLAMIVIVGLTVTGVWQFFTHVSDPSWFDHIVGSSVRQQTAPSSGVAAWHGTFSTAAGAVALIGGAWYAYKVVFSVPWLWVLGLCLTIFGSVTGSLIRFNAIKKPGQSFDDVGAGYPQVFFDDVEYVVTDRWDFGPMAIRLFTLSHVLTVAVLVIVAWLSLGRVEQPVRQRPS